MSTSSSGPATIGASVLRFDDCNFRWQLCADVVQSIGRSPTENLDTFFGAWASAWHEHSLAQTAGANSQWPRNGVLLIHANGCFTTGARRQDLQGVDILKHIRLTRWLDMRWWPAIVYSFETLEAILRRQPGSLILLSPRVKFLRLPDVLDLEMNSLRSIIEAHESPSEVDVESLPWLRPFVACDFRPLASGHGVSNWWGVYELWRAIHDVPHPELQPDFPEPVRNDVGKLRNKQARFLDAIDYATEASSKADLDKFADELSLLRERAVGKTVFYIDDEANKGWADLLDGILQNARLEIVNTFPDADWKKRAQEIFTQPADLILLDLRLLGTLEAKASTRDSSGIRLARELRSKRPHVPITLFTASNKAETLMISQNHEVDAYWVKPGIGEHQSPYSPKQSLMKLVRTLSWLLGREYRLLVSLSAETEKIKAASPEEFWWGTQFDWPGAIGWKDRQIIASSHSIKHLPLRLGDKNALCRMLESMLAQLRFIYRLEWMAQIPQACRKCGGYMRYEFDITTGVIKTRHACAAGTAQSLSQDQAAVLHRTVMLDDSLFNQMGKIIELVHGFRRLSGSDRTNGTIGGYSDRVNSTYHSSRRDWLAHHLYSLRNDRSHLVKRTRSHLGSERNESMLQESLCDLFAWLTTPRADGIDCSDAAWNPDACREMAFVNNPLLRKKSNAYRG